MPKWLSELHEYRSFLFYLVLWDVKSRYKGTVLGFLWSFLNPVVTLVIFWFVFSHAIRGNVRDYPLFLACGYIPWQFLSNSLSTATPSISNFSNLIRNIYFPKRIVPLAQVLSNLVHSFITGAILLIPLAIAYGIHPNLSLLVLPVLILLELIFAFGLSLLFSCIQVHFRDTQVLLAHILYFWFFLTPIFYSIDTLKAEFQWLFLFNPMALIVDGFRTVIMKGEIPEIIRFAIITLFAVASLWIGSSIFGKRESYFAEEF